MSVESRRVEAPMKLLIQPEDGIAPLLDSDQEGEEER